jgi:hypothetical protein
LRGRTIFHFNATIASGCLPPIVSVVQTADARE